jgi:CO/xanthine dehydrogenase FAD-binding subunit
MAPGRYNTPYDFPIRQADHDVHFLFLVPGFDDDVAALGPLADLVVNLVSDAEHDDAILPLAASVVARLAKPTVNHPDAIALTGRTALPARLAGIAGCRAARIGRYPGAALRTRSEPRSTGCSPARPQRPDAAPGLRAVRGAWETPRTPMCATARPTRLTGCRSTADHLHTNDRERRLGTYLRPVALHDALAALAAGPRAVVAGGTDHYPARAVRSPDENILDISALSGLRTIARRGNAWVIPCLATWTDLIETSLPPMFAGLVAAARQVGGVQIQNAGTVVGNLCNASPAADGIPCLLALDASVELASVRGTRLLPLRGFLLGPRQIARRPDELVTAILLSALPDTTLARFDKLGGRRYLVISIAMLATVARLDADGTIADPRLAIGACSATAQRLPALEAALRGRRPNADLVRPAHLADLAPIDDGRATAAYRRAAALELLRRAVAALASPHPAVAAAA